jgi:hypothetical protein
MEPQAIEARVIPGEYVRRSIPDKLPIFAA